MAFFRRANRETHPAEPAGWSRVGAPGNPLLAGRVLLRKISQLLKFYLCFARGYGVARQLGGAAKIFGDSGDHECGGGVRNNDVEPRPRFAGQEGVNELRVFLRRAAADGFERGP